MKHYNLYHMNFVGLGLLIQTQEELLTKPKGVWKPRELTPIYAIYNAYTGETKYDQGCGACRTGVVNKVRAIYEEYKKTL
jgi:hypothetical protein